MASIPKWFPLFVLFLAGIGFASSLFAGQWVGAVIALGIGGAATYWLWRAIPAKPAG